MDLKVNGVYVCAVSHSPADPNVWIISNIAWQANICGQPPVLTIQQEGALLSMPIEIYNQRERIRRLLTSVSHSTPVSRPSVFEELADSLERKVALEPSDDEFEVDIINDQSSETPQLPQTAVLKKAVPSVSNKLRK